MRKQKEKLARLQWPMGGASRYQLRCENANVLRSYFPPTSFHKNVSSSAVSLMACVRETPALWPLIVW
jgi:hypothetical protein